MTNRMMWRYLAVISVAFVLSSANILAQTSAPQAPRFSYEVVSIKPASAPGSWWRTTRNSFSACMTVQSIIESAYGLIMSEQVSGLPVWASSDDYVFDAKMDEETAAAFNNLPNGERKAQYQAMLQAVLQDRFRLKVRRETKELPIYALVVAKGGPKFKETPQDKNMGYRVGVGSVSGTNIQIPALAATLTGFVRRIIVDKTGLTGKYDIDLHWSLDDAPPSDDAAPPLFTALQEQLGLKLEPAKGPVDSVVIEHIERPTEN